MQYSPVLHGNARNKIYIFVHPLPGAMARVQNGFSGSSMDAVFELVAHKESDSWTSLLHSFTEEGLLQLPEFVYPLYK